MSNYFAQGDFTAPHEDPYFAGDQVLNPREVVSNVHTQMWRKTKGGQMRKITYPPYEYREFPKVLHGIGVEPLTVRDPDEEQKAIAMGYEYDHPSKVPQLEDEYEADGMSLEVSAVRGNISKNGKRLGRPPKNQYPE